MNFEARYQEIEEKGYEFSVGDLFDRGWSLFTKNAGPFILLTFVLLAGTIALSTIPIIGGVIGTIYSTILMAGIYIVAFKIIRDEEYSFGDFFLAGKYTLTLILASLLSGLFIVLGWILIIPGAYLVVAYFLINPFIVDKDLDFWDSMEYSRRIITKKWFSFCWLAILLTLVNIVGTALAGIGLLVTIPFTTCILAVCYDQIVGVTRSV